MIHHFNFKDKVVEVSTDQNNWYVQYSDEDNLIHQYKISYPHPNPDFIRVAYSWQIKKPSNNDVIQSGYNEYHELAVNTYYDAILPVGVSYGHFAAYNSINGLIARLPQFDGNKQRADGYRIFKANGDFYQPVVFDIINVTPETRNHEIVDGQDTFTGQGDGGFQVQIHNGVTPFEWRITSRNWRSVETVYSDLPAGDYTVEVRDAAGTLRYATVTVPANDAYPVPEEVV